MQLIRARRGEEKHSSNSSLSNKNSFNVDNPQFPRWGHDNSNTFANLKEKTLTKSNVKNLVEKWNFNFAPTPDPAVTDWFVTQPLIVKDTVYVLSGLGFLYALDLKNGKLKPGFNGGLPVFVGIGPGGGEFGGNAGSTPVVFGDFIYCATDDMVIRSFNRNTGKLNPNWPTEGVSIPVHAASHVSKKAAIAQAEVQGSLSIVDDGENSLLFVVTSSSTEGTEPPVEKGTVTAFDLKGKLIWSEVIAGRNDKALGAGGWSTPSFDIKNKLMFFGTSNPQQLPDNKLTDALQARDYRTGKLVWNYQYVSNDVTGFLYPFGVGNPVYLCDRDVGASPNVFDVEHKGEMRHLVGANGKDGIYRAFDRTTGDLAWVTVLTNIPMALGNPSASFADGVLYTAMSTDSIPSFATPMKLSTFTGFIGCDGGSTPGAVLTVTGPNSLPLVVGQPIIDPTNPLAVIPGTVIVSIIQQNSDGTGTYVVNIPQAVSSRVLEGYPFSPNLRSNFAFPSANTAAAAAAFNPTNPLFGPSLIETYQNLLASTGIVTALDAATGKQLWKATFPTLILGAPIFANGIVYVGFYDGAIRALNAKNGHVLKTFFTPPTPGSPSPCSGSFEFEVAPGLSIPFPCNNPVSTLAVAKGKIVVSYVFPLFDKFGGVVAFGL